MGKQGLAIIGTTSVRKVLCTGVVLTLSLLILSYSLHRVEFLVGSELDKRRYSEVICMPMCVFTCGRLSQSSAELA